MLPETTLSPRRPGPKPSAKVAARRAKIAELLRLGYPVKEVAQTVPCAVQEVYKVAWEQGWRSMLLSREERAAIAETRRLLAA
jgi:hypothetical protein